MTWRAAAFALTVMTAAAPSRAAAQLCISPAQCDDGQFCTSNRGAGSICS